MPPEGGLASFFGRIQPPTAKKAASAVSAATKHELFKFKINEAAAVVLVRRGGCGRWLVVGGGRLVVFLPAAGVPVP